MKPEEQIDATQVMIHTNEVYSVDSVAIIALIVTIALAAIGWAISIWLQQKNHKQEQRAKINYEIYSQLVTAHKELQDAIASFNASTQAPLILMSAELIPLEIRQRLGDRALTPVVSEEECLHKGRVKYSNWIYDEMLAKHSKYQKNLSTFMYLTEDWTAPLSSTRTALEALRSELSRLNVEIATHKGVLQRYATNNGDDWRQWNDDEVRGLGDAISAAVTNISNYISDYMVLAHNELLAPYYGHTRLVRKTYDDSYQVITKEGLVTRIEDDPKIRAYAESVINRQQA
jgi:hypothetical protein